MKDRRARAFSELGNTPVSTQIASNGPIPVPGLLSNVATIHRDSVPTNLNQANIQPVYEVYASAQGRDLGSISDDISKITAGLQKELKPGNTIQVLGQIQSMHACGRAIKRPAIQLRGAVRSIFVGIIPLSASMVVVHIGQAQQHSQ